MAETNRLRAPAAGTLWLRLRPVTALRIAIVLAGLRQNPAFKQHIQAATLALLASAHRAVGATRSRHSTMTKPRSPAKGVGPARMNMSSTPPVTRQLRTRAEPGAA